MHYEAHLRFLSEWQAGVCGARLVCSLFITFHACMGAGWFLLMPAALGQLARTSMLQA